MRQRRRVQGVSPARPNRPRRQLRTRLSLVVALAIGALVAAGPHTAAATDHAGTAFRPPGAIGALFTRVHGKPGRHFCTASVVKSPKGNLLITAAHCVTGRRLDSYEFAPGYYKGKFPHGIWRITKVYVDRSWASRRDPNDDVAFLVTGPAGSHIQQHTGAETLQTYQKLPVRAHVVGYPALRNEPITCTAPARAYDVRMLRQIRLYCGGYTDGTSGGPFLVDLNSRTRDGKVFGVIGGFEEGGNKPYLSYSCQFRTNIRDLYKRATS